jgi:hypothetical protein
VGPRAGLDAMEKMKISFCPESNAGYPTCCYTDRAIPTVFVNHTKLIDAMIHGYCITGVIIYSLFARLKFACDKAYLLMRCVLNATYQSFMLLVLHVHTNTPTLKFDLSSIC